MMQEVLECRVCITLKSPAASEVLTLPVRSLSIGTSPCHRKNNIEVFYPWQQYCQNASPQEYPHFSPSRPVDFILHEWLLILKMFIQYKAHSTTTVIVSRGPLKIQAL